MDDNSAAAAILVPLFGMIFVFGFPITAWIVFRWLAHRERMEMIRAGMTPPAARGSREWRQAYNQAQAATQPVGPRTGRGDRCDEPYAPQVALRKGITLAFIGFALTIGLSFIGLHDSGWRPGPWLLGGLIPMFIGVSQVFIAVISGATLGPAQGWIPQAAPQMQMPPISPSAPSASTPPGAGFDGSYTYRPGATQELQKPYSPPERRP